MSQTVVWELQFIAVTITLGVCLSVVYDLIRIFRRIIRHGTIWMAVEDILFWAASGIVVFVVSFWENNGSIRWYTLAGIMAGAGLYHGTISDVLVKVISGLLIFPINIIKNGLKKVVQSFRMDTEEEGDHNGGKEKKEKSVHNG